MLRDIRPASSPSAIIQVASGLNPASFKMIESGTPVHSLQLSNPWLFWTTGRLAPGSPMLLPPHSIKQTRDADGNRFRSSENVSGRSTRPSTSSRCDAGSSAGTPEWCRSKCGAEGVMMPCNSPSGVRLEPVPKLLVSSRTTRKVFSCGDRSP